MSGDDSRPSLRAPAQETVFRPFPLASPSGPLYIERMFLLRLCINQSIHYLRLYRSLYSNSLMRLMLCTRPDLAFTVSMLGNSPPLRLLSTWQQPPTRYDTCDTQPTSPSSTMHQTLKSPYPLATQTRTSLETPITEKPTSGYVFTILNKHAEQYPNCLC